MSEEYTHHLLRMVAGRICQPLGWQAIHSSACDVLVDIMKHYMLTVAKTTSGYSCHGELFVLVVNMWYSVNHSDVMCIMGHF